MERRDVARMANQMSDFFKSYGEAEAIEGIADHINKFWEPRMRKQFFEELSQANHSFSPLVVKASALIKRPKPTA